MKKYLVISGIVGGMAGSIITVLLVLPVTAQHQHGKFRDIECNFLRLVDKDGKTRLILDPNGDSLAFHAEVFIGVDEYGGRVIVSGKDRESWASLGIHEHGGGISARGNYGKSWGCSGTRHQ